MLTAVSFYSRRMDRPRILLAEDHPVVAEQLRGLLESCLSRSRTPSPCPA